LASSNWKDRQQSIESIVSALKRMIPEETPCQVIVRTVAKKPGFKDSHFQVLKQRIELVAQLADTGYKFSQRTASYCLADIADKIGDVKSSQQAKDALSKIGDQCTLAYVCVHVLPAIFEGKNPKNQEHALLWLGQAIKEFGFQGLDTKMLLAYIKSALQNSNAAVRVASVQLIGVIFMYLGANFRGLFDQEKPALLEQIDAEIEKVKGQKAPVPMRGKNVPGVGASAAGGNEADAEEEITDPVQLQLQQEALMPRTDISTQLTDTLMEQLNDKNWKERQAALEKIDQILNENKFIEPNVGEFPTNLGKRLTDSNKILATLALKIAEKLAQALGSQGRRYVSVLAPGMIQALSDNKETLRKAAVSALNTWFDSCGGLAPFIEGDLLTETFTAATNPNIKAELCGWLSTVLPKSKSGKLPPELKAIVPSVFAYIEDRNPEVRTKAQELVTPLMAHVGFNEMMRTMQKITNPKSVSILQPLIEKAKAEIAARQPPPPAAAAAATVVKREPAAKQAARNIYEDDETDAAPPPAKKELAKVNGKANAKEKETAEKAPGKQAASGSTTSASSKKKNADDEDLGPVMQVSNKAKRIDEEKALKTLKWNFDVPRKEFVDQLRTQMEMANFNKNLITQMFHDDFKYHIIALQTLTKAIDELSDATLSNLDIILRWLTLRFFETNPTVMLKAIDYMKALFSMLYQVKNYHLHEFEAGAFIPYFIVKLGDPKDPIRKGFREIIKQIAQVYSPVKIFNFLVQGLVSKNSRQRAGEYIIIEHYWL
jgi:cytoskeleton-associated protein 5